MRRLPRLIFTTALLAAPTLLRADHAAPSTAPATQPQGDEPRETMAQAKAKMSLETAAESVGMPVINAASMADVMTISIRENDLHVSTPLEARPQSIVSLPGLIGLTRVRVDTVGPADEYTRFQLENIDFTAPDTISIHTSVSSVPGNLQFNQDFNRLDDQAHSVQLIQVSRELNPDQPRVTLHVQITGDDAVRLHCTADNIVELRRAHPAEVARYVDPIFRALRQDGLLAKVDPKLAWQVFADAYQPPPDLMTRVQALVKQLDADNFQAREQASQSLEQLGQPAALALRRTDRHSLSDEQRGRVDAFLAKFKTASDEEAQRYRRDREFLIDCLHSDDVQIRSRALDELRKVVGRPVEFDVNAPPDQRLAAIDRIRAQVGKAPATQHGRP